MVACASAGLLKRRAAGEPAPGPSEAAPEIEAETTPEIARIGPNAILQMLPVLEAAGLRDVVLKRAGIVTIPSGDEMIPQAPAAALHQALRVEAPDRAAALAREAGLRTGEYILAHRIPGFAQAILRHIPRPLAARALSRAITRHAWTFAGSGQFRAADRWHFALTANPIVAGETSAAPLCHWHAAVFERLYTALVDPDVTCVETACCAQGAPACTFAIEKTA